MQYCLSDVMSIVFCLSALKQITFLVLWINIKKEKDEKTHKPKQISPLSSA